MNKERFEELSEAIRQAKAVRRGGAAPSRVWNVTRGKDGKLHRRQLDPKTYQRQRHAEWENTVADTRSKLHLSQDKFAELLGISVKTLHNWEQGRRKPTGAARVLLRVVSRHPDIILEEVAAETRRGTTMKKSTLKTKATHYTKLVEWSDEDGCFVGSAPPLVGACCHGDDEAKVYAELCQIVEEWIELLETDGNPLPKPLGKVSDFSGKFVLRVEPAIHRRLAAKALAAGESLNSYCVKTLVKA